MVHRLAGIPSLRQPEAPPETAAEREDRIRREAQAIARGEASLDAGKGVDLADAEHWLDALDHDETAPRPGRAQPSSRP